MLVLGVVVILSSKAACMLRRSGRIDEWIKIIPR
jgi:hypothetical protein